MEKRLRSLLDTAIFSALKLLLLQSALLLQHVHHEILEGNVSLNAGAPAAGRKMMGTRGVAF